MHTRTGFLKSVVKPTRAVVSSSAARPNTYPDHTTGGQNPRPDTESPPTPSGTKSHTHVNNAGPPGGPADPGLPALPTGRPPPRPRPRPARRRPMRPSARRGQVAAGRPASLPPCLPACQPAMLLPWVRRVAARRLSRDLPLACSCSAQGPSPRGYSRGAGGKVRERGLGSSRLSVPGARLRGRRVPPSSILGLQLLNLRRRGGRRAWGGGRAGAAGRPRPGGVPCRGRAAFLPRHLPALPMGLSRESGGRPPVLLLDAPGWRSAFRGGGGEALLCLKLQIERVCVSAC